MRENAEPTFGGRRSSRRLHADLEDASRSSADQLTPHLQQHARSHGWSEDAVKHLYVEYGQDGYHPRYRSEGSATVEAHEFGGLDNRARPAMRTWALHSHEHASDVHDQALRDILVNELF